MDYNDYVLNKRMKAIADAEEEASHFHAVQGYVVCRYPVTIEYDDREYDSFDAEELMVDEACRKFNENIYYMYDEVEILKED